MGMRRTPSIPPENPMFRASLLAAALVAAPLAAGAQAAAPTDAQIAHIAYTAGQIDVAAGRQALEKASSPAVRAFAETMVRDHTAVNDQALALVKRLGVTPQDNPTSEGLLKAAAAKLKDLAALQGAAFDRAYVANEVAFHQTVNGALESTLIPSARNAELKSLLQTGLQLFRAHQGQAEMLAQAR
jgi:putative membrane protein